MNWIKFTTMHIFILFTPSKKPSRSQRSQQPSHQLRPPTKKALPACRVQAVQLNSLNLSRLSPAQSRDTAIRGPIFVRKRIKMSIFSSLEAGTISTRLLIPANDSISSQVHA